MALIFQYGSNTSTERFNSPERLSGDARSLGAVYTLNNFELDFTVSSVGNACAAADLISGCGRKIWGVLYEIPDYLIDRKTSGDRKSLDAIEGGKYERQTIKVAYSNGVPVEGEVLTYVVKDKEKGIRTSLDYCRHIITGLREHSIPEDYIQYVKERITANNLSLQNDINKL